MKKTLLFFVLAFQSVLYSQEQWWPIGPDDYNQLSYSQCEQSSIAIDSDNIPYMAFQDFYGDNIPDGISVRKFINGTWENVGLPAFSNATVISTSIAIDSNNIPYVAYSLNGGSCFVKKFINNTWENVGTLGSVYSAKILFDSQDNLYLVGSFGIGPAGLRKFNGTSWINVGPANISSGGSLFLSAAFDSNDIPYVAYSNLSSSGKLTVKKLVNNAWQNVGAANVSQYNAQNISLKIDGNNIPYVAYKDNNVYYAQRALVKKFDGTSWVAVGPLNGAASTGGVDNVSLNIDQFNVPTIAYYDVDALGCFVKQFDGENWTLIGQSWIYGRNPNVDFDSENNILVGFQDLLGGIKKFNGTSWEIIGSEPITVNRTDVYRMTVAEDNSVFAASTEVLNSGIKVWKWNGEVWENLTDENLSVPHSRLISIKTYNNIPYILFLNDITHKLSVKKYNGSNWESVGPDEFSPLSQMSSRTSMVIDNEGTIFVAGMAYISGDSFLHIYKYSSGVWTLISANFPIVEDSYVDIAIGNDNRPAIVYSDSSVQNKLSIRKLNASGTSWDMVGNGITANAVPIYATIAVDSQNITNVSFATANNFSGTAHVYSFSSGTWTMLGESLPNIGCPRLSIDNSDIPYISYYDFDSPYEEGRISVKKYNGTGWEFAGIQGLSASRSSELQAPDLLFNTDNIPILGYDCQGGFVKYFGNENSFSLPQSDFVNLSDPGIISIIPGETATANAQILQTGITEMPGASEEITAWIGVSDQNTPPSTWNTWIPATFYSQNGSIDEYSATIGGGLSTGTYYYASRFQVNNAQYSYGGYSTTGGGSWDGVDNISGILTVGCNIPAPEVNSEQSFCGAATVNDLLPQEGSISWYDSESGGIPLDTTVALTDGQTYYVAQAVNGCESSRTPVTVTITSLITPTFAIPDQICEGSDINPLSTTSLNGVSGTWTPSFDSNTSSVYTFTPDSGQCSEVLSVYIPVTTIYTATTLNGGTITAVQSGATYQWIDCANGNIPINGATGQSYTTAIDGEFAVTIEINGCTAVSDCVSVALLGTVDFTESNKLRIYPIPATDILTIETSEQVLSLKVTDILGKTVVINNFRDKKVNIENLEEGVYFLQLITPSNIYKVKFIKK